MSARLRILPFDSRDLSKANKIGIAVSSVAELIQNLRESHGNPDKPVRLLVDDVTGVVLVAKFGFGDDNQRQPCIEDELKNQQALVQCQMPKPHIALMQWGGSTMEPFNYNPSCVMCTEYIKPLGTFHTLRQLATDGDDETWRQALFQTLWTLASLQRKFPGYRHNDLKADNVLVSAPAKTSASYAVEPEHRGMIRRVWRFPLKVWAKLIDFELSCTPEGTDIKSRAVLKGEGGVLETEYGLSAKRCDVFDVHLLLFDTLGSSKKNSRVHEQFASFVYSFVPQRYFSTENLTKQCRLSLMEQDNLDRQMGPHLMVKMLAHPYFFHLRGEANDKAEYVI